MNWKIAVLGLMAIALLLAAFSTTNTAVGYVAETINIKSYGLSYSLPSFSRTTYSNTYGSASGTKVSIRSLEASRGQVITRTMTVGTNTVTLTISTSYSRASNVVIYTPLSLLRIILNPGDLDVWHISMDSLTYNNLKVTITIT
jgi:hypothetical protein